MIPSQFVVLESFPCTAHGKIDLEALPEPDNRRPELADAYRAPRTDTETRLAAIFGDLLGVEKIGIDDNFFALGGHSLLVIKVVHRVNESLGTAVPVRALFESPTVSQLAKRIDEFKSGKTLSLSAAGHEVEPLVPMQADRAPCSLFCFHHVGGQIHSYAHLASALRGTCQVYGIQSRAVADPSREHHSLDAMVDDYVNVLVHHQQTGPFFLLGYSTAGILTMAVAHALERAGRTVDLVVLLDPTSPSGQIPQIDNDQLPAIVMSLRASFGNEMASITQDEERLFREGARINERLAALPEEERAGLFSRWLQTMSLPQEEAREILNRRLDLIKRHYELLKSYRPSQIQAPMFICWPAKSLTGPHAERFAWETCTKGPVHTETIDADHFGMVRPPSEQVLARRLSEYMTASRIQAESPLP
jgi:thioesterase domain-containing protein/acyl carrier protein